MVGDCFTLDIGDMFVWLSTSFLELEETNHGSQVLDNVVDSLGIGTCLSFDQRNIVRWSCSIMSWIFRLIDIAIKI